MVLSAPVQARKKQVYLTEQELNLLEQDGVASLKDHPDPKALKREFFEVDLEKPLEEKAAAHPTAQPTATPRPTPRQTAEVKKKRYSEAKEKSAAGRLANKLARQALGGSLDSALARAKKESEKNPAMAVEAGVVLWNRWLKEFLFEGDDAQAEKFLRLALALDPDDVDAHEALGALYWRASKDTKSKKHYRQALQLDPSRSYLKRRLNR